MIKRLLEAAERILSAILSGFACFGLFILIWVLLKIFAPEEPRIQDAGIPVFLSMLLVHAITKGLGYVRSLLWETELDELIREGSKSEQEKQGEELYEHLTENL